MGNTKLANPAPLGLMGFDMTTILLNLHNAGFFALDGIILAMGIFYGGLSLSDLCRPAETYVLP